MIANTSWLRWQATLFAVALIVLSSQTGSHAQTGPVLTLPFSNGFLVTGNYVVSNVDLPQQSGGDGFLTGTIPVSGVPSNAEILSAFLYWETISSNPSQLGGVKFRGRSVDAVRTASIALTGPYASCWSSGGGAGATYYMNEMRADVRRLLPFLYDANGESTGRLLVNDTELLANGYPLNTVTLPEAGTGNLVPQSAGASLVVVYRDPTKPLTRILFYEPASGGSPVVLPNTDGATFSLAVRGIFQSSSAKSARLTPIVASGQPNGTDRLFFNGSLIASDPFPGSSVASDRSWSGTTYDVSTRMPGTTNPGDGFGETVNTTISHLKLSPYDCLSVGAVIFSTAVKDDDHDGIPDGVEDAVGGLTYDANGTPLPDLHGMGATSSHKDIFIEMDAMRADAGTSYGSPSAPFDSKHCAGNDTGGCTVTDLNGHNHMPKPAALKILIDTYNNAAVTNPDGSPGIRPHFDVGNPGPYIDALGSAYAPYFFPVGQARGGDLVLERPCGSGAPPCRFQAFPGTVSWLNGFLGYSNTYFDRVREGLVHWVFYVHARGMPKSLNPLSRDYSVPSSISGVGQLPGGKAMISVGLWDKVNFVGTPELNAGTTLHELGHNSYLFHGGPPPVWNPTTRLMANEANCKPNYLSVMNYSFVAIGMHDDQGVPHFDYSRDLYGNLDETYLSDGSIAPGPPMRFRTAWFAPLVPGTLAYTLGVPAAKRFCPGAALPTPLPANWVPMGRIEEASTSDSIDFKTDGDVNGPDSGFAEDVNFDGVLSGVYATPAKPPFQGFNDWLNIRLDQTGGGNNTFGLSQGTVVPHGGSVQLADGSVYLADGSVQLADGSVYLADGSIQLADGSIQLADGSVQLADGSVYLADGSISLADGSVYLADGSISLADGSVRQGDEQEQNVELFAALGHAPVNEFRACVIGTPGCTATTPLHRAQLSWKPASATGDDVLRTRGFRVAGGVVSSNSVPVDIGATADGTTTTLIDGTELPDGALFTYFAKLEFSDGSKSGPSNFSTIKAVNDAPVAVNDTYTIKNNTTLTVAASGVLSNDTDDDSPATSLRAVLVSGPSNGVLTLNADGSFTYVPKSGFKGTDTFTYKAYDTCSLAAQCSAYSNVGKVTINVTTLVAGVVGSLSSPGIAATVDGMIATTSCSATNFRYVEPVRASSTCTALTGPQISRSTSSSDGSGFFGPPRG